MKLYIRASQCQTFFAYILYIYFLRLYDTVPGRQLYLIDPAFFVNLPAVISSLNLYALVLRYLRVRMINFLIP
jgi:hypothetical protein